MPKAPNAAAMPAAGILKRKALFPIGHRHRVSGEWQGQHAADRDQRHGGHQDGGHELDPLIPAAQQQQRGGHRGQHCPRPIGMCLDGTGQRRRNRLELRRRSPSVACGQRRCSAWPTPPSIAPNCVTVASSMPSHHQTCQLAPQRGPGISSRRGQRRLARGDRVAAQLDLHEDLDHATQQDQPQEHEAVLGAQAAWFGADSPVPMMLPARMMPGPICRSTFHSVAGGSAQARRPAWHKDRNRWGRSWHDYNGRAAPCKATGPDNLPSRSGALPRLLGHRCALPPAARRCRVAAA